MWVIVLTHRYNEPDVLGPFNDEELAVDHLENNIKLEDGWDGSVVKMSDPYKDE